MRFKKVYLEMTDKLTGKKVSRAIDISNIIDWNTQKPVETESKQMELLECWINERGNKQHNTLLKLDSWLII